MADASDDGLRFDPSSVTAAPVRDPAEYDGRRVTLIARLGSARIPLHVDIGFGDAVTPDPEFATFQRRGTALPDCQPVALTDEFARSGEKGRQWTAFLDRVVRASTGLALSDAVRRAAD